MFLKQQIRSVGMQVKHINNVYIKNELIIFMVWILDVSKLHLQLNIRDFCE